MKKGFTIGQLTTAVVVGVPLGLAGICLYVGDLDNLETEKIVSTQSTTSE